MDCSPPDSFVRGISQVSVLEWVAISFFRGSSPPRIRPGSPALASRVFTTEPPGKPILKHSMCLLYHMKSKGFLGGSSGEEPTCNLGDVSDVSLSPVSERPPGGGHGSPLQHSCWRIPWTEEPGGLWSIG